MDGNDPADAKQFDKTPDEMFIQMSELNEDHTFWVERSRWIKYEECKEEGAERWGKPHLSSLSFHSLTNLRLCLEKGIIVLDYDEAKDFTDIVNKLVEECSSGDNIMDDHLKAELRSLLLIHHKFVDSPAGEIDGENAEGTLGGLRRTLSNRRNSKQNQQRNLTPSCCG